MPLNKEIKPKLTEVIRKNPCPGFEFVSQSLFLRTMIVTPILKKIFKEYSLCKDIFCGQIYYCLTFRILAIESSLQKDMASVQLYQIP